MYDYKLSFFGLWIVFQDLTILDRDILGSILGFVKQQYFSLFSYIL